MTRLWLALVAVGLAFLPVTARQAVSVDGWYDIQPNGGNTTYMRALTSRHVAGDLRLLSLTHTGVLKEFSLSGKSFGQSVTTTTNSWTLAGLQSHHGIWYEEATDRLFVTGSRDYVNTSAPAWVKTWTLNANGSVSNLKTIYLSNVNDKRMYGGCRKLPASWKTKFGSQYDYACGWGGYTSLVDQGGGATMGLTLYLIPDPAGISDGGSVTAKVILDARAASTRGYRETDPINYFDGGDPRQNPSSPPTNPPLSTAQFLSPNAAGKGWFVWGDSYYNNGEFIGDNFVAVATLCKGKCWYQSSTLNFDDRQYEWHTWSLARLDGVNLAVRPDTMTELLLQRNKTPCTSQGNTPSCNISGVTTDSVTGKVYLVGYQLGGPATSNQWGRLYRLSAGGAPTPPTPGDTTPPTVSVTAPTAGASVTTSTTVSANASDNDAVAGVVFTLDGTTLATDVTSPYSITWDPTSASTGSHTLRAVATDLSGNSTTSAAISVTVTHPPPTPAPDTTRPVLSLTAPLHGSTTTTSPLTITATASDNIGVTRGELTINGALTVVSFPLSRVIPLTTANNGTTLILVRAFDAAGNVDSMEARVTVAIPSTPIPPTPTPGDTTAPVVTISAPTSGATITTSPMTITATAADAVGVTSGTVSFNGASASAITYPYSTTVALSAGNNGIYGISLTARDAAGNIGTTSRNVTVNITPSVGTCDASPGVLTVQRWPERGEGSREVRYTYTVDGLVTTITSVVLQHVTPGGLTVVDARGCTSFVASPTATGVQAATPSTCTTQPGQLSVQAWPTSAEGAKRLRYSYTVRELVTHISRVTLQQSPLSLTVVDARGCTTVKGR